jgi:hypothetical protein
LTAATGKLALYCEEADATPPFEASAWLTQLAPGAAAAEKSAVASSVRPAVENGAGVNVWPSR